MNDRDVETAFRLYAGKRYRQHNPLVEDGQEEFAKWIGDSHPNAHGEIKRAFADADFVILPIHHISKEGASITSQGVFQNPTLAL